MAFLAVKCCAADVGPVVVTPHKVQELLRRTARTRAEVRTAKGVRGAHALAILTQLSRGFDACKFLVPGRPLRPFMWQHFIYSRSLAFRIMMRLLNRWADGSACLTKCVVSLFHALLLVRFFNNANLARFSSLLSATNLLSFPSVTINTYCNCNDSFADPKVQSVNRIRYHCCPRYNHRFHRYYTHSYYFHRS